MDQKTDNQTDTFTVGADGYLRDRTGVIAWGEMTRRARAAGPPKSIQEQSQELLQLAAQIRQHAIEIGPEGCAKEANERESAWRAEEAAKGAERVRLEQKVMQKLLEERAAAAAITDTTEIDRQTKAKQDYDAAIARIEHDRVNTPIDYAQGEATLELRRDQQARRDDIALHETRVKLAGGQPGRY